MFSPFLDPIEEVLLYLFNHPALFLACTVAFILLVIGGFSWYVYASRLGQKRPELRKKDKYLELLKMARADDIYVHGEETAQDILDEWERVEGRTSGKRGLIRLQKFNLRAETFLRKRNYLP